MSGSESDGDGSTQGSEGTDAGVYSEAGSGEEEVVSRRARLHRKAKGGPSPGAEGKTAATPA